MRPSPHRRRALCVAAFGLVSAVTATAAAQFSFGSYGRVNAASDLRGGSGRPANIVAYGSRLDLPSYAEIQLERKDSYGSTYGEGVRTNVVFTLGLAGPFFHETGKFEAQTAVRNLYAEVTGIFHKSFTAWVGSRMYRGDDIYLLNWWPLDNLNMVGGGVKLALDTAAPDATTVAIAVGLGRSSDPFSYQTTQALRPTGLGTTDIVVLDRPRVVVSERLQHIQPIKFEGSRGGVKVVLYAEQHAMSRGVRTTESGLKEELPSENGSMIGAQLGFFTGKHDTFVNLFFRYATGIAAYGDKTVPGALSLDRNTNGAHEALAAISSNVEIGPLGVLLGAYVRGFRDASGNPNSRSTFNEGTFTIRPQLWIGEHVGVAAEYSFQSFSTAGVNDAGQPDRAKVNRLAFVPFLTPGGRGSFSRPQLSLVYVYTARDAGARALYPDGDRFARRSGEHYLGLGAEWWFNSSYR